jgi:uncharacterized protein (DUF427 family)
MSEVTQTKSRAIKIPGPEHPIAIERNTRRVVVKVGGQTVANSGHALTLREADYSPVWYIPRKDIDMKLLERSDHVTYCRYKGECSYFGIPIGETRSVKAASSYEDLLKRLHPSETISHSTPTALMQWRSWREPEPACLPVRLQMRPLLRYVPRSLFPVGGQTHTFLGLGFRRVPVEQEAYEYASSSREEAA